MLRFSCYMELKDYLLHVDRPPIHILSKIFLLSEVHMGLGCLRRGIDSKLLSAGANKKVRTRPLHDIEISPIRMMTD